MTAMPEQIQPVLTYSDPKPVQAGFSLGQPVLDLNVDGGYVRCLYRSCRNQGRRLELVYHFNRKGRGPVSPKFETLEELILWFQCVVFSGKVEWGKDFGGCG